MKTVCIYMNILTQMLQDCKSFLHKKCKNLHKDDENYMIC